MAGENEEEVKHTTTQVMSLIASRDLDGLKSFLQGLPPTPALRSVVASALRGELPAQSDEVVLVLLTRLFDIAMQTHSYATVETECLRGLILYKSLAMRPEATGLVNEFLYSVATLLAARHRFAESSQRFYELYMRTKVLSHLCKAIVCAIQADASVARSRLLGLFYKDENAALLGDLYTILGRAYNFHVLRQSDLQRFLPYVESSPTVVAAVTRAFVQHNLQAVSRVYYNIGFSELGSLLGITALEAERLVAQMVTERRLDARLDQTTETVIFARSDNASVMAVWDAKTTAICEELAHVADLIVSRHPEFNDHLLLK